MILLKLSRKTAKFRQTCVDKRKNKNFQKLDYHFLETEDKL